MVEFMCVVELGRFVFCLLCCREGVVLGVSV